MMRWPSLVCSILLAAHLAAAQTAPTVETSYTIAGTVVSGTDGHLLDRTRVTLRDVNNRQQAQSVITSEDGRFAFHSLPAGKYSLEGAKRGFIAGAYDQHDQYSTAIVTGPDLATENLVLKLTPDAVISGKVLDEAGEPVRRAMVTLYYQDHQEGVEQIHVFRNAETDDLGDFELTPLRPGTYFLSASAKPWYAIHPPSEPDRDQSKARSERASTADRSLDITYPVTYYQDVTDAESATPIQIRGGEHTQVDLQLNPVPALRLIFRTADDGRQGFTFPQFEQPAFDGSANVQTEGARMVSPGLWEVSGIPAGRYNIRIPGPNSVVQMNGVDFTKDGEEINTSAAEALSDVKVSVQISGETTIPERLMIGLRGKSRSQAIWQQVDAKGQADLPQVPAGRYQFQAFGPGRPYSVARLSADGAQVSGHMLTVPAGASPSVSLTLVAGSGEIRGTALRAGKGFAGAMVVLVPKDPEGKTDLFRRDQSDLDGTFTMRGVIPGSYTVLAIEGGWDLDWSQPDVIGPYAKRGRSVEVGSQPGKPVQISEGIEVQPK
jgi:hypothetical protein